MAFDQILTDNLGPAFVMVGEYGDTSTWSLVGRPEYYFDQAGFATMQYGVEDLEGVLVNTEINIEGPEPAAAQDTNGIPYGTIYNYGSFATITLETTVATAWSIARLCTGVENTTVTDGGLMPSEYETPYLLPKGSSLPNSTHIGIGIKPLRSAATFSELINPLSDPHDWWFASVYPSKRTSVALSNASGGEAQNNFTFELKTRRVCSSATKPLDERFQIGGQMRQGDAQVEYGDSPSWSDLIPPFMLQ